MDCFDKTNCNQAKVRLLKISTRCYRRSFARNVLHGLWFFELIFRGLPFEGGVQRSDVNLAVRDFVGSIAVRIVGSAQIASFTDVVREALVARDIVLACSRLRSLSSCRRASVSHPASPKLTSRFHIPASPKLHFLD